MADFSILMYLLDGASQLIQEGSWTATTGVVGSMAPQLLQTEFWRKNRASIFNHSILRNISHNHHLSRGVVWAWCVATQEVLDQAKSNAKEGEPNPYFDAFASLLSKQLDGLLRNAHSYQENVIDSAVIQRAKLVIDGVGVYSAPNKPDAEINHQTVITAINEQFPVVISELTGWEQSKIPQAFFDAARLNSPISDQNRSFGELVLAAYADILKNASNFEIRTAQELADRNEIKQLVKRVLRNQATPREADQPILQEQYASLCLGVRQELSDGCSKMVDGVKTEFCAELDDQTTQLLEQFAKLDVCMAGFQDRLDDIHWSVKSVQETVNQLTNSINQLHSRLDRADFLLDLPYLDKSYTPETIGRFGFKFGYDNFRGRKLLIRQLRKQLLEKQAPQSNELQPFAWCALCAPAGSGKSRFAREFLISAAADEVWRTAGFAYQSSINQTGALELIRHIQTPTVVVIDYAGDHQGVREFLQTLAAKGTTNVASERLSHPVRVLLLERRKNDPVFNDLRSEVLDATQTSKEPIELPPLAEINLVHIIRGRAADAGKNWDDDELGRALKVYEDHPTPLGAAIVGDLIGQGILTKGTLTHDTSHARFQLYGELIEDEKKRWLKRCNGEKRTAYRHTCLSALATFVQGLPYETLDTLCEEDRSAARYLGEYDERDFGIARYISGHEDEEIVSEADQQYFPLQPDLLAERFLLDAANPRSPDPTSIAFGKWLRKTAWKIAPNQAAAVVYKCFQDYPLQTLGAGLLLPPIESVPSDVLARLIRNLASDIGYLCQDKPAPETELEMVAKIAALIDAKLLGRVWDEATNADENTAVKGRESVQHLGAAIHQMLQIAARVLDPSLPEKNVGPDGKVKKISSTYNRAGGGDFSKANGDLERKPSVSNHGASNGASVRDDRGRTNAAIRAIKLLPHLYAQCIAVSGMPCSNEDEAAKHNYYSTNVYVKQFLTALDLNPKNTKKTYAERARIGASQEAILEHAILAAINEIRSSTFTILKDPTLDPNTKALALAQFSVVAISGYREATCEWEPHYLEIVNAVIKENLRQGISDWGANGFFRTLHSISYYEIEYHSTRKTLKTTSNLPELLCQHGFDYKRFSYLTSASIYGAWASVFYAFYNASVSSCDGFEKTFENALCQCEGALETLGARDSIPLFSRADLSIYICLAARRHTPDKADEAWDRLRAWHGNQLRPKHEQKSYNYSPLLGLAISEEFADSDKVAEVVQHALHLVWPELEKEQCAAEKLEYCISAWLPLSTSQLVGASGAIAATNLLIQSIQHATSEIDTRALWKKSETIARLGIQFAMLGKFDACERFLQQLWSPEKTRTGSVRRMASYLMISILALRPVRLLTSSLIETMKQIVADSEQIWESAENAKGRSRAIAAFLANPDIEFDPPRPINSGSSSDDCDLPASNVKKMADSFEQFDADYLQALNQRCLEHLKANNMDFARAEFTHMLCLAARSPNLEVSQRVFSSIKKSELHQGDPFAAYISSLGAKAATWDSPELKPYQFQSNHSRDSYLAIQEETFNEHTAWNLEPLYQTQWQSLNIDHAVDAILRTASAFQGAPIFEDLLNTGIQAARTATLSCYENVTIVEFLCNAKSGAENQSPFSRLFLFSETGAIDLKGKSPCIHHLNATSEAKLQLDSVPQVLDYLRFFCGAVHGQEGPFHVIETSEDLERLLPSEYGHLTIDLWPKCRPTIAERAAGDADTESAESWQVSTNVQYEHALFHADFRINAKTGMVEMLGDNPIETQIPFRYCIFTNTGRRRLTNAKVE
ncbi:hypothetical protein M4951_14950 [Blastopirellula sp. J2-11]|uniref:hypothetical protein n=1 Tax=Blastopirellula sp. J2-11 TaxID=2943192 RepID=UPI0021C94403|nr:hypothetical protein [Blastopirellula sp. J2-11]UUO04686.1 hypothetical protein M4951_14950 [Blastopirellula sp. J2-11]